jgi:hypothetical protein
MASNPPQTSTDGEYDIILQAPDGVKFPIRRAVLEMISPVFTKLFSKYMTPKDEGKKAYGGASTRGDPQALPVVSDERLPTSPVLDYIIKLAYYQPKVPPHTLDDVIEYLDVAEVWKIDALTNDIRRFLTTELFLEQEPFRVYAVACRFEWEKEARRAAHATLCHPWRSMVEFDEMDRMTGRQMYRLESYRRNCGEAAEKLTEAGGMEWISRAEWSWFGKSKCWTRTSRPARFTVSGGIRVWFVQNWWWSWMETAGRELRDKPCRDSVRGHTIQPLGCMCCEDNTKEIIEFEDMFGKAVDEAISRVSVVSNRD